MNIPWDDILKLVLAIIAGGLVGAEREFRDKAAGLRTLILICVGSALFTMLSLKLGGDNNGTRIAASVVTGVGFLGAGVILRDAGRVLGLTTAASIWLTSALGMAIGGGYFWLSGVTIALVMLVLWLFPFVEHRITSVRDERVYEVICTGKVEKFQQLEVAFTEFGLRSHAHKQVRSGQELRWTWALHGPPHAHERFIQLLMGDAEIDEFRF